MTVLTMLALVVLLGVAIALVVMRLLYVCQPSEVLIFSGRRHQDNALGVQGYRVIRGGRALKVPFFERVDRMDLTNMIVDVSVQNAYSKGGIPLTVQGVANIKVPGEEPLLTNTLERFLGQGRDHIKKVAQDTLEGNLRGVLATLTPEEVNQDKERFASQLATEAETDLSRLGLVLDTLKIQNVSDQVGYLDAIGRQRSASVRMNAQIAEADARASAAEQKWANSMRGELSRLDAEIEIARQQNERRIADAESKRETNITAERAEVGAAMVEAKAQLDTQLARVEQVRLQLEADRIQQAEAQRKAMEEAAKGEAAQVIRLGQATAQVLKSLANGQVATSPAKLDALLMQKLLPLMRQLAEVGPLPIERVTLLAQSGQNPQQKVGTELVGLHEQLRTALGLNLQSLLTKGSTPSEPQQEP